MPSGPGERYDFFMSRRANDNAWLHEIKHDGFRIVARKDGHRLPLCRPSRQVPPPPLTRESSRRWRACVRAPALSTAEAVACDDNEMAREFIILESLR